MSIGSNSFYTQQAAQKQAAAQAAATASNATLNNRFASQGLGGFMDFIAAHLATVKGANQEAALTVTPDFTGHNQPVDATLTGAEKSIGGKLKAFLQSLLAGMPSDNGKTVGDADVAALIEGGETLTIDKNAIALPPALIAAGMTPEEIADLLQKLIEAAKNGEDNADLAGLVQILPMPVTNREALFTPRSLALAAKADAAASSDESGAAGKTAAGQLTPLTDAGNEEADADLDGNKGFERVLKILEQAQQTGGIGASSAKSAPSAGLSTVRHIAMTVMPEFAFTSSLSGQLYPDGFDWSQPQPGTSAAIGQGLTINGPALMTSLVTNASQATQAHPATQMIAATVTKAATDGQKNITLKLDPPELGRIEVRMEFEKDKHLKVHLAVEKQETYLMLQRDAHILERALADAGMNAGQGGLSFELAQDGSLFDHNHNGGGNGSHGKSGQGDEENFAAETVLEWRIDAQTGHTRYDILA